MYSSEVPTILKKFIFKEATLEAAILKLTWQPSCVYVMSFHPTLNCWEKNLQPTWYPSPGQQNLFFQAIIHFTMFNAFILETEACLAQNNTCMAQEQP